MAPGGAGGAGGLAREWPAPELSESYRLGLYPGFPASQCGPGPATSSSLKSDFSPVRKMFAPSQGLVEKQ